MTLLWLKITASSAYGKQVILRCHFFEYKEERRIIMLLIGGDCFLHQPPFFLFKIIYISLTSSQTIMVASNHVSIDKKHFHLKVYTKVESLWPSKDKGLVGDATHELRLIKRIDLPSFQTRILPSGNVQHWRALV